MNVLHLTPDDLIASAERDFEQALGGMRITKLVKWNEAGLAEPELLDAEFLKKLTHDERRFVFDQLHDIAVLPVYEKNCPQERAEALDSIDKDALDAKWRYMLAFANGSYDLGLDYVDLEILTPLYRQLATIERGATNVRMPTTHKLRHNPSIHSLHVVGLMHDVFTEAEAGQSKEQKREIQAFSKALMRSALVHDMGELQGELSIAADRAKLTAAEVRQFEMQRGQSEAEVFETALEQRKTAMKRCLWPAALLEEKCEKWQQAYERGEAAETFEGRVHKVMERMQSQQDYLRFEGKDMTPRLSARLEGYEDYREFFYDYALEPLTGCAKGEKVTASLKELAEGREQGFSGAIFNAVNRKATDLQARIAAVLNDETQHKDSFVNRVRAEEAKEVKAIQR